MAWSASGGFRQAMIDIFDKTLTGHDFDASSMFKVALYNNSVTPDFDATAANSAFNASTWTTTNEVSQSVQFPSGGVVLANNDVTGVAGGIAMLDADDTASGSAFTATNIYGCLIYMDAVTTPVADQGLCAIYFGGTAYGLTNGTFTIQWSASGIYRWDVA
jgi:hypothetical protein